MPLAILVEKLEGQLVDQLEDQLEDKLVDKLVDKPHGASTAFWSRRWRFLSKNPALATKKDAFQGMSCLVIPRNTP